MSYPHILNHSAIAGVTGSSRQLRIDVQHSLLFDIEALARGAQAAIVRPPVGRRQTAGSLSYWHSPGRNGATSHSHCCRRHARGWVYR